MGLHGVVLLMDMDQWTTHVRKATGYMRTIMDMDHTVFVADLRRWMNDGNLTASAARPPSWTPTMAAEPAPSAMSSRTVEVQTNVVRDDDAVRVRRRRGGAGSSALYGLVDAARVRGGVVSEALLTGFTSAFKGEAASSCAQLGWRRRRWVLPVWRYRADVGGRGAFRHAYLRDQSLRDEAARPANDSRGSAATAGRGESACEKLRGRLTTGRAELASIISNSRRGGF